MPTYTGADGVVLHYDVVDGDGGPGATAAVVVLAGGPARHPEYLAGLLELLGRAGTVVPHLRGVGRSPTPADLRRASFWSQAEDLELLRRHLGVAHLVLVGHSAGTRLAVSYAAQFPDRVAGMALLAPPAGYLVDEPSDAAVIAARRDGDPHFVAAWAALQSPDTSDDDAFNAWQRAAAPAGYAVWGEAEQAHAIGGRWSLAAARAFVAAVPPDDLAGRLRAVTAPVLVVAGAQDALVGLAPVRAMAALFRAGRLAVLADCGHYPWVEQPTALRRVVDPFLDELGPGRRGSGAR